jgi:predicted nucleic acid-binding Zn ribbon protein
VRRHALRPLSAAVEALAARMAPTTALAAIQTSWPEAVGEAIAREARPVAERDGVVTVACRSAVWAQELDLMGAEVVERLNQALGDVPVRRLRCVATGGCTPA